MLGMANDAYGRPDGTQHTGPPFMFANTQKSVYFWMPWITQDPLTGLTVPDTFTTKPPTTRSISVLQNVITTSLSPITLSPLQTAWNSAMLSPKKSSHFSNTPTHYAYTIYAYHQSPLKSLNDKRILFLKKINHRACSFASVLSSIPIHFLPHKILSKTRPLIHSCPMFCASPAQIVFPRK